MDLTITFAAIIGSILATVIGISIFLYFRHTITIGSRPPIEGEGE